jgi:4-diphosphocytidyl-2-C-methyl-D-erythritol kinase
LAGRAPPGFALFDEGAWRAAAATALPRQRPGWWVKPTLLS